MQKIKLTDSFTFAKEGKASVICLRNTILEYIDKFESYATGLDIEEHFQWNYRVNIEGEIYVLPEDVVVEVNNKEIINKDFTEDEWVKKGTDDALVKDGNYVKAWIGTFNIDKPVKDRADQCDYAEDISIIEKKDKDVY